MKLMLLMISFDKARIKQIKKMTKNHLFISVELLQFIHDLEIEWKTINEIWLAKQDKKDKKKKKPRLEKSVEEEDDDLEIVTDKFDGEADFISFDDDDNGENAGHAEVAEHGNLHTNHSIDDEFLSGDFFDDMGDEYVL